MTKNRSQQMVDRLRSMQAAAPDIEASAVVSVDGLIMASPLTVCLVVMGRHIPHLGFLSVLLGDKPSLPSEARVYQRLLAMDYDEVFQFTQDYLKDKPLIDLYENVLLPALAMAEHDRHAGRLE